MNEKPTIYVNLTLSNKSQASPIKGERTLYLLGDTLHYLACTINGDHNKSSMKIDFFMTRYN